jgi:glyoxylase-like metal-dependent hydrolase (beta-lactamase superfamily II)
VRVFEPSRGILAFYDGREEGATLDGANWVEYDLVLGVASYAIVDGESALVYDTHTSPDRGEFVRAELERRGVRELTVALSHWHLDHIAGAGAFSGCEVISTRRTADHLASKREAIEGGTSLGPPPIDPVVMPTKTFAQQLSLTIGARPAELIHFNIHSDDAAVLWLPRERVLLSGDTLEDTVTFVDEPSSLELHLTELARLAALGPARILPAHGDPEVIAQGGYGPGLIDATQAYIRRLIESRRDPSLRELTLREFTARALADGTLRYHPPYETVHRDNLARVAGA